MRHINLYEDIMGHSPDGLTLSGRIPVYHFTTYNMGEYAVLEPKETINKRNFWSNNDYRRSDFPRVFYFTSLAKTERMIKDSSNYLYRGFVNGDNILHLKNSIIAYEKDKEGLKEMNRRVYEAINQFMVKLSINFDILFQDVSLHFDGIYYEVDSPIINFFIPLEVNQMDNKIGEISVA